VLLVLSSLGPLPRAEVSSPRTSCPPRKPAFAGFGRRAGASRRSRSHQELSRANIRSEGSAVGLNVAPGFSPASSVCSAPRLAFVAQGAVTRLSLRALGVFHRARPAPSGALVGCSVLRSPSGGPLAHFVAQVSRRLSARHLGLFGSPCIPKAPQRATQLSSGRRNATFDARPGTFCCHHEVAAAPGSPTCAGFAQVGVVATEGSAFALNVAPVFSRHSWVPGAAPFVPKGASVPSARTSFRWATARPAGDLTLF
jgi:hypothetical protein